MRHESVLDQASPQPWFSREERPFIRPLRKTEMLCVLIREWREESNEKKRKKRGKSGLIFICIILKGAQIGFIPVTVNRDPERTMTISEQKSQRYDWTGRVHSLYCLVDYRDECILSVAQGEGNTFHSTYCSYHFLRPVWLLNDCYQRINCP